MSHINTDVRLGPAIDNHGLKKTLESWLILLCGDTMLIADSPITEPGQVNTGQPAPVIKCSGIEFTNTTSSHKAG